MRLKSAATFFATFGTVAALAGESHAAQLLYANSTTADAGRVKAVDLTTQAPANYYLSTAQQITGLAADDAGQRAYVTYGTGGTVTSPANFLYTYDYQGNLLGSSRPSTASGAALTFSGLAFAGSTLYGVRANGTAAGAGIWAVDPSTGAVTQKAALSGPGAAYYNFQDLDYDQANNRFLGINTAVPTTTVGGSTTIGSEAGLYSIVLPANGTDQAVVTKLANSPTDAPTGNLNPDGLAYDGATGIVYLTYNRGNSISRYSLTSGTYLTAITGPAQAQGASGGADATLASGFTPEPASLATLFVAGLVAGRRRRR